MSTIILKNCLKTIVNIIVSSHSTIVLKIALKTVTKNHYQQTSQRLVSNHLEDCFEDHCQQFIVNNAFKTLSTIILESF